MGRWNGVCTFAGEMSPFPFDGGDPVDAAYPLPSANPSETKSLAFGITSVVFAVLTVLLPVIIVTFFAVVVTNDPNERARAWAPVVIVFIGGFVSLMASGITSALGTVAGVIALARHERKSWLATLGLIVNVPVMLFAIYVYAVTRPAQGG